MVSSTLSECNTEICAAVSGGSRTSACSDRYTRQYHKEQDDPRSEEPLSNEDVLKLNVLLNTFLQGLTLQDINLALIQTMRRGGIRAGCVRTDFLKRLPKRSMMQIIWRSTQEERPIS